MAIPHGLAGQYPKGESHKRTKQVVGILLVAGAYSLGGLGFLFGYSLAHWGPAMAIVGMVVAAVAGLVIWRPLSRHIDRIAKDRIKLMRGAQGEALVAAILGRELGDDWHVFNGVKLERDRDIDHVVVGPGGLYCVSTKSHRGLFTGTPDGVRHNGQPSPFAQQALRQTMALKDRLDALMGRDVPWVQAILAVPLGFTEGDACGGKVWLVHQDDISDRVAPENGPRKLSKEQVSRTVKVLAMIQDGAADVYRRPDAVAPPAP